VVVVALVVPVVVVLAVLVAVDSPDQRVPPHPIRKEKERPLRVEQQAG